MIMRIEARDLQVRDSSGQLWRVLWRLRVEKGQWEEVTMPTRGRGVVTTGRKRGQVDPQRRADAHANVDIGEIEMALACPSKG